MHFKKLYAIALVVLMVSLMTSICSQYSFAQTIQTTFEAYRPNEIRDGFSYFSQGTRINWRGLTRTSDKGKTWKQLIIYGDKKTKTLRNINIDSVIFISEEIGFLYGWNNAGIWKTIDSGKTWKKIFSGTCYNIWTDNKQRVIAQMGNEGGHFLYLSSDMGETWKATHRLKFPGDESDLGYVVFLDDGAVCASFASLGPPFHKTSTVGIAKSKDNGLTWNIVYKKTGVFDEIWRKLVYYDNKHGWALPRTKTSGWWDIFYYTADGGISWQKKRTPRDANFSEIIPLTEKKALMLSWRAFINAERYVYLNTGNNISNKALNCKEMENIFKQYSEKINRTPLGEMLREAYYAKRLVGYSDGYSIEPCQ
jgi:photosystem II stability/assembly factor-like uncharacterized protein